MPSFTISISELADECLNEEEFEMKMDNIDAIYDEFDNCFYQYGNETINEKIIDYVRQNHLEIFDYVRS